MVFSSLGCLAFAEGPLPGTPPVDWHNNYTIEYVPDGGHFLMFEKPDLVVDRIKRALPT